jgi:hypothetical protein
MSLNEIVPLLMHTIDRTPNPLAPKLSAMESQVSQIEHEFREFLTLGRRSGLLSESLEFREMTLYELMNMNRAFQSAVIERMQVDKRTIDQQQYEFESARESLESVAGKLRRLLRRDAVDVAGKNMNELFFQIHAWLDELMNGGTEGLYMSIADLNDMSKACRKWTSMPNSNDCRKYLPELFALFQQHAEAIESAKKFTAPLDSIYKGFDFQPTSYNPEGEPFKFLREKIFQLHLLHGSDETAFHDDKLSTVFQRLIALSAALMSYIASSFLTAREEAKARS